MNTQEIIENNNLIAKYDYRLKKSRKTSEYWHSKWLGVINGEIGNAFGEESLKYHNSFNWLMSVIEKMGLHSACIIEINYALVVTCRICYLGKNKWDKAINFYGDNNGGEEPIMAIYKCVVEFLKFLENGERTTGIDGEK